LAAQASMSSVEKKMQASMERLSTGLRINSAKDDAAGLAISTRMTSQIRGYAAAIRNSNDGISMVQTAEGALGQVTDMLQRMRELAVQSSNGSNSSTDRISIQLEVAQLKAEIQNVAVNTNHNNIKLLDGSAGKVKIQTGVDSGQNMAMNFGSVQTKDIGLGHRASLSSVGGAVVAGGANDAMSDGDLTFNGVVVGATLSTDDKLSYTNGTIFTNTSAIAKAAAINRVSAQSGVSATVGQTNVYGGAQTAATPGDDGLIMINGVTTAAFYLSGNTEIDRTTVAKAINDISAQTGVVAINNHDDKQGLSLIATDGRNIVLDLATPAGTATNANMGLAADGTYVGSYEVTTLDGRDMTIGSTVAQSQSGEKTSGLSFGTFQPGRAQVVSIARASSVVSVVGGGTDNVAGILNGNTMTINGVMVPTSILSDDTASAESDATNRLGSSKADSAIAIAAAINKVTDKTGVTAKASANVLRGIAFDNTTTATAAPDQMILNGVTIDLGAAVAGTAGPSRDSIVSMINQYSGQTGVIASAFGEAMQLEAADGRNISISVTGGDAGTSMTAAAAAVGLAGVKMGDAADTGTSDVTYYSSVSLQSDKEFTIDSGNEGDVVNLNRLGFRQGTYGGTDNGLKIAELDLSTISGATNAIDAIDSAIETLSSYQARAGAYQNRLEAVVSNLTESNQNMSASRSRILDTDYATETTSLARSQIISQAATAMLAQANQSAQSVLSLLK